MEETYATDLRTLDDCRHELSVPVKQLAAHAERVHADNMIHETYVKLRSAGFRGTTVEYTSPQVSLPVFSKLLAQGFERRGTSVRLLGVSVRLYEFDARAC